MRKEEIADGIIEDISDLASDIESSMWEVEDAVDKINNKIGELQELKKSSESARSMTIEEIAKMIKLYKRMRLAQKEGDDVLVDFILEQIDALVYQ